MGSIPNRIGLNACNPLENIRSQHVRDARPVAVAPAEFRQSPKHAFRTLRRVSVNALMGATVEGDRWEKVKGSVRGLGRSTKG